MVVVKHSQILMSACRKNSSTIKKRRSIRLLIYVDSIFPHHLVFMCSSFSKVSIFISYDALYFMMKEKKYSRKEEKKRVECRRHSKWLFKVLCFYILLLLMLMLLLWFLLSFGLFVCLFVWNMVILCRTSSQAIAIIWL